tara:strand:+ start:647 stop:1825 length:1179 start_codon:yes stop_codon:yes gene_type:complete
MASGQVAQPEFYVDYFLWLNTIGSLDYNNISLTNAFDTDDTGIELCSSLLRLNPSIASPIPIGDDSDATHDFIVPTGMSDGSVDDIGNVVDITTAGDEDPTDLDNFNIDYVAYLNHNFKTAKCYPYPSFNDGTTDQIPQTSEIINYPSMVPGDIGASTEPSFDGFSILGISETPDNASLCKNIKNSFAAASGYTDLQTTLFLGSVSMGHKYTCPVSPDLRISMQYDVGYKRKDTINGRRVAHLNWFRETGWEQFGIKKPSWSLDDQIGRGAHRFNWRKSGRRTWNLNFSYMSSGNVFPDNLGLTTTGMSGDDFLGDSSVDADALNTLMGDDSMIAQLLHKTCFGYLPFIFRPDNTYARSDGFCIAMIDMKKFTIKQVAHKIWSVKLKIVEVI